MKTLAPFFALIIALGAIAGCQKPEDAANGDKTPAAKKDEPAKPEAKSGNPVGSYQLIVPDPAKAMIDDAKTKGQLPKDAQYPEMTFSLKADGSAEMAFSQPTPSGVQKGTGKGTWKSEGDKIIITPTEKDGKPITNPAEAQPLTLVWSADKTMLETEEAEAGARTQFKKTS